MKKSIKDSSTLMSCGNVLEHMYNKFIDNGASKNEFVLQQLKDVISRIRNLENKFK